MNSRQGLKRRAVHELREYLIISFYLFVVFSLLIVYKSLILSEHHINYTLHGFALINALALAKVMLVAQDLRLADHFKDAPLIYPTLSKSLVFTVLLTCVKIAEDATVGHFRGHTLQQSLADFGGGTWQGILTLSLLVLVMLVPFFGFTELRRVFGSERLYNLFFQHGGR